jgi:hypothetical protein
MAIYTSNYARKGGHPNSIAISAGPPKYYTGATLTALAPSWDLLNAYKDGYINKDEYKRQYINKIEVYDIDWYKWLDKLPDPTFLLCFEAPGDFCHRHIFAEWVDQKCGWIIPEWLNPKEVEEQRQDEFVDNLLEF